MNNETKPCPACNTQPYVGYLGIAWVAQCRNRDCPQPEATNGISGMSRHSVINQWNQVIVPSVKNTIEKEYAAENHRL